MHFPSNPSIPQVTFLSALTLLLRAAVCFPLLAAMFLRVRTMALAALSSPAGRASRQPRTQFLAVALTAAVLAFLAPTAQAAAGDLDPLNPTLVGNYVLATTVQPDGKLILAGKFTSVLGVTRNNLARLNADGTLDSTFNPNPNGDVNSVTVQPDGRILIGGSFSSVISTTRNRIARLNADGTLDTVFNPNANGAP